MMEEYSTLVINPVSEQPAMLAEITANPNPEPKKTINQEYVELLYFEKFAYGLVAFAIFSLLCFFLSQIKP